MAAFGLRLVISEWRALGREAAVALSLPIWRSSSNSEVRFVSERTVGASGNGIKNEDSGIMVVPMGKRRSVMLWSITALAVTIAPTVQPLQAQSIARPRIGQPHFVSIGGRKVHIDCRGRGSRTAILVAGLGDSSLVWADVQTKLPSTFRTCSYDRAGIGNSDPTSDGHDPVAAVRELYGLLRAARVKNPIILVGHSYGGDIARLFAARNPSKVAALVLVEASNEDKWDKIDGLREQWRGGGVACTADVAKVKAGETVEPPSLASYPPSVRTKAQIGISSPAAIAAACAETHAIVEDGPAQVAAASFIGSTPLVVITAKKNIMASDTMLPNPSAAGAAWHAMQRAELTLSTNARQVFSCQAGHQVPAEDPELVADVITRVAQNPANPRVAGLVAHSEDCAMPKTS